MEIHWKVLHCWCASLVKARGCDVWSTTGRWVGVAFCYETALRTAIHVTVQAIRHRVSSWGCNWFSQFQCYTRATMRESTVTWAARPFKSLIFVHHRQAPWIIVNLTSNFLCHLNSRSSQNQSFECLMFIYILLFDDNVTQKFSILLSVSKHRKAQKTQKAHSVYMHTSI